MRAEHRTSPDEPQTSLRPPLRDSIASTPGQRVGAARGGRRGGEVGEAAAGRPVAVRRVDCVAPQCSCCCPSQPWRYSGGGKRRTSFSSVSRSSHSSHARPLPARSSLLVLGLPLSPAPTPPSCPQRLTVSRHSASPRPVDLLARLSPSTLASQTPDGPTSFSPAPLRVRPLRPPTPPRPRPPPSLALPLPSTSGRRSRPRPGAAKRSRRRSMEQWGGRGRWPCLDWSSSLRSGRGSRAMAVHPARRSFAGSHELQSARPRAREAR